MRDRIAVSFVFDAALPVPSCGPRPADVSNRSADFEAFGPISANGWRSLGDSELLAFTAMERRRRKAETLFA